MTGESYEPVIGLEIHVQLATQTKMFCRDRVEYGAEPNTLVCPVCLGLPGALPVVNRAAVTLGVRAALGLDCTVHRRSVFARKNYFYPDLPKGYQITQHERPLATDGRLAVPASDEAVYDPVRIRRVHLEEDTGKSVHDRFPDRTGLDLNRAGVPLIEIVTEPDLRSPAHARAFLLELKRLLEYLEVSDCDMEKGSLRVDANVSVRPEGSTRLGVRTEVKNLNSFTNVQQALAFEADRQARALAAGGTVVQETRLWDVDAAVARPLRAKEETHDYRYFPEPDLPPLDVEEARIASIREALPERPADRERRYRVELGLPAYDASVLTASRPLGDYFEAAAEASGDPKAASNWVMTAVLAWLNETDMSLAELPIEPESLAELIGLIGDGTLSSRMGQDVFRRMAETGERAGSIVEAESLAQVGEKDRLIQWIDEALAESPDEAERLRGGEDRLIGFFMGRIMQKSGGAADPGRTRALLRERIDGA